MVLAGICSLLTLGITMGRRGESGPLGMQVPGHLELYRSKLAYLIVAGKLLGANTDAGGLELYTPKNIPFCPFIKLNTAKRMTRVHFKVLNLNLPQSSCF